MQTTKKKAGRKRQLRAVLLFLLLLGAAVAALVYPSQTQTTFPSAVEIRSDGETPTGSSGFGLIDEAEKPSPDDPLLRLINPAHPLAEGETPTLTQMEDWDYQIASVAYDDLCQMLRDGRAAGLRFQICSAYRSREVQQSLFDEDVARLVAAGMSEEAAVAETAQYTMPPGCSEHESGLALDIVSLENQLLDESQAETPETRWLHAHCWEYGFILRYPPEKSAITGIAYEPWHYRYVGREAAQYLTEHHLTLEEYWGET